MIKVKFTPPFSSSISPNYLDIETEIKPIFERYKINIVRDIKDADFEICGFKAGSENLHTLPKSRVIIIDGEPPQPQFIPQYYLQSGYAGIICPANGKAYADDCLAYFPSPEVQYPRRKITKKINKIIQMSTYRNKPNLEKIIINGEKEYNFRVLCKLRVDLGLWIKVNFPELIDIYGSHWPFNLAVENSRIVNNWYERKSEILPDYGFDLCWENMEIPFYTTEKLWHPISLGVLPIYWGCPEIHQKLPPDSIIDCRNYVKDGIINCEQIVYDINNMSEAEYIKRVNILYDWYESFPQDAAKQSLKKATHMLACEIITIFKKNNIDSFHDLEENLQKSFEQYKQNDLIKDELNKKFVYSGKIIVPGFEEYSENDILNKLKITLLQNGLKLYQENNLPQSEETFQYLLKLEKNSDYFFNLGLVQFKLEKYNEAVDSFSESLEIGTSNYEVCFYLAQSLEKLGEFETANYFFEKANLHKA